jgi:spermidine/putrescine-binding protein
MQHVIKPFGEKFGVRIVESTVSSQNEMLANVKATPGQYDVVRASDAAVFQGVNEGLLEPLDLNNIPNFQNLQPRFRKLPCDPGSGVHVLPAWPGAYVMVKVTSQVRDTFDSYAPLYDQKYAGRITLRDYHAYRVLQTILYLGYNMATLTQEQERRVFGTMRQQHKMIKTYWKNEAEVRTMLANRDAWIADYWDDSTLQNQRTLGIDWWIPKEGTPGWTLGLSIAKGAPHKRTAEALFNYLMDPGVYMPFIKAMKMVPLLRKDLWDEREYKRALPDMAIMVDQLADRVVPLDLVAWTKKQREWTEMYEQIKMGG